MIIEHLNDLFFCISLKYHVMVFSCYDASESEASKQDNVTLNNQ